MSAKFMSKIIDVCSVEFTVGTLVPHTSQLYQLCER